jgi:hypothetical protein
MTRIASLAALGAAIATAGCMQYAELRAPLWTETVAGTRSDIAGCVLDRLRMEHDSWTYERTDVARERVVRIVALQPNALGGPKTYFWELALIEATPAATKAELRAYTYFTDAMPSYLEPLPDLIKSCAV